MSTDIEWTATKNADGTTTKGETWNPLSGCSKVSAGCAGCYAIKDGGENLFRVSTPDGVVEIRGTGDFVVKMVRSLCEESTEFLRIIRENLVGETHESLAASMRRAGFDEEVVSDFENDNFWDDIIYD